MLHIRVHVNWVTLSIGNLRWMKDKIKSAYEYNGFQESIILNTL